MAIIMGAMAAGLATMGAIIMPIIMGAGRGRIAAAQGRLAGQQHRVHHVHDGLQESQHQSSPRMEPCPAE